MCAILNTLNPSPFIIRKMVEIKSQAEKDKTLVSAVIKRSDIFGESAGGAGLDDQKVKEVRNELSPTFNGLGVN